MPARSPDRPWEHPDGRASGRWGKIAAMAHTLVCFHAHPDDEALLTAGVMAAAAADGHRVVLVVATRGEVGLVAGDFLADGETLADRRWRELARSALELGVRRLEWLGYADSGRRPGHDPTERRPADDDGDDDRRSGRPAVRDADVEEAAERLAEILNDEHADVLTTYDPNGGYGHPDHLQVHRVGQRAGELAGTPIVLEATINRDLIRMGADLAGSLGFELPARVHARLVRRLVHAGRRADPRGRRPRPPRGQAGVDGGPRQPGHRRRPGATRSLESFLSLPAGLLRAGLRHRVLRRPRRARRASPPRRLRTPARPELTARPVTDDPADDDRPDDAADPADDALADVGAELHRKSVGRRRSRACVSLVALVVMFALVLPKVTGSTYREVAHELDRLSVAEIALARAWCGPSGSSPTPACSSPCCPGCAGCRASCSTPPPARCRTSCPSAAPSGSGATYGINRSWGFGAPAITLAILVSGVWNVFLKLGLPVLALVLLVLRRRGPRRAGRRRRGRVRRPGRVGAGAHPRACAATRWPAAVGRAAAADRVVGPAARCARPDRPGIEAGRRSTSATAAAG